MNILVISICTFLATLFGGLFALKYKDKLHLILGFSAGAVIGVAFFDLIPESIELAEGIYDISTITLLVALGFIVYMILDRTIFFHSHNDEVDHDEHNKRGVLGALSLSIHSLLDGIAIGLAFQVSISVGSVVTLAVLVHDFSDGLNTVNMILKNNGTKISAFKWLMVDAIAPVIGIISTLFFTLSGNILCIILSLFAGSFLYIGASDLLPESHHNHPTIWTTVSTVAGILALYVVIKFAGI